VGSPGRSQTGETQARCSIRLARRLGGRLVFLHEDPAANLEEFPAQAIGRQRVEVPILIMKYRLLQSPLRQFRFWRDYLRFSRMADERPALSKLYPILDDADQPAGALGAYFYQAVWAARLILSHRPATHVDVGSQLFYVGMLSTAVPVTFLDLRPVNLRLPGLTCQQGTLLAMPFPDASVQSLSCLHVVEHVGLGRYGDVINPEGTRLALGELVRVLAPGGFLYVSAPIGRPHVRFNAHRVLAPEKIVEWCGPLRLASFAAVDSDGNYLPSADRRDFEGSPESYGFYQFTR